jgi:hypothetical protein
VHTRTLLLAAGALCLAQAASAQFIAESFVPSFPRFGGGNGFAQPWNPGGFNAGLSQFTPRERSLCYPHLESAGGAVTAEASPYAINGAVRQLSSSLGADNTTRYISFLIQPQGTLNDGIYNGFFGMTLGTTPNGASNELFIGKPGAGATDQFVLETRGGGGQMPSGAPVKIGRTTLIVVKAEFRNGADVFTMYVNPTSGSVEPLTGVVKSDLDVGFVNYIGLYASGAFTIDEIKIGATYADVVQVGTGAPNTTGAGCLVELN